jgi:hypothetical protein
MKMPKPSARFAELTYAPDFRRSTSAGTVARIFGLRSALAASSSQRFLGGRNASTAALSAIFAKLSFAAGFWVAQRFSAAIIS